jgi:hypothetical protein
MLMIQRSSNGQVIFTLTGGMSVEHVAELKALFRSEAGTRQIVLDLKDLTLVDRDAAGFSRPVKRTASSSSIVQLTSASGLRENELEVSGPSEHIRNHVAVWSLAHE